MLLTLGAHGARGEVDISVGVLAYPATKDCLKPSASDSPS